ncbi:MAG: 3-hydroxyacyl-CoA dehydrogenase NAD-binding domain-containing protein [Planctomycetaceae bacterium]
MSSFRCIRSVSVIGAGLMGRSIAALNVDRGRPVKISDLRSDVLDDALAMLRSRTAHDRGIPSPHLLHGAANESQIGACKDPAELAKADLIVETIAEKLEIKRRLFSDLAPHLGPRTIVATNTSSIPLDRMADCLPHRERFCGLHFFHPVERRPLVEVIRGPATSDETLAAAVDYATALGRRPVVVKDRPGFVVNRVLVPYLNEALELILEGAAVDDVERAAVAFGMPLGPLRLLDEIGIDVAVRTGMVAYLAFPDRVVPSPLLIAMYKADRLGRKSGGGFFPASIEYCGATGNRLSPQAAALIRRHRRALQRFSPEEITRRLFLPPLLEATRILEERLVAEPEDVDAALRDGLGFLPSAEGLLRWADCVGAGTILEWLRPLQALGPRFEPTALLSEAARQSCGLSESWGY